LGYVAATWERPNRHLLGTLFLAALLLGLIIALLPRERIVRGRYREEFFLAWAGMDIALIAALVAADGGVDSPLIGLFVLPLIFSALSYPLWSVVVLGALAMLAYVSVGLARNVHPAELFAFAGCLGLAALLCAWQARTYRRVRAELAQKEKIEQASQAKSEFLSRVSHELRTPLNAILGFGQVLEDEELGSEQRDSVRQILKGGRHLLELINEVLDLSRIEAGNMSISLEPVDVRRTLTSILDLVRPLATQLDISLDSRLDGAGDRYAEADEQRLKQVLLNLLSNAIKYNRQGGSITVRLEEAPADQLRIHVSDTGRGMSEEQLAKLFSPFERLGAERSSIEGTGLGLTLSRGLVDAMGGTLGVKSEVGVGTTFVVELALAASPLRNSEETECLRDVPSAGGARGKRTVLHVEDNLSNFKLVERVLAGVTDLELLAATEGNLGLELARQHHPDLILLDLHLPGISGEEVLQRLRSDPKTEDIPVLVVSADATAARIKRLLESGASGYLTKPLDVKYFLEVVDTTLNGTNASNERNETQLWTKQR
jgi:signal transduction histidine kinase/CheY-like chemotaxis protein